MSRPIQVVTVADRAEHAAVGALAASLRVAMPGAPLYVLWLDQGDDLPLTIAEVPADELRIGPVTFADLRLAVPAADLGAVGLAPALRWAMARHDDAVVVYLDPSIEVLGPLDAVADAAVTAGWTLLPRAPRALPDDGCRPDDAELVARGAHRTALFAFAPSGAPILDRWVHIVERSWHRPSAPAIVLAALAAAHPAGLPSDADQHLHDGNVAGRTITHDGTRVLVDGLPVATVDVDGLGPDHRVADGSQRPRRLRPSEHPALAALIGRRMATTTTERAAAPRPCRKQTPRFARLSRHALLAAMQDGEPLPPSLAADRAGFTAWSAEPEVGGRYPVSRFLMEVRRGRVDLLDTFPAVPGHSTPAYLEWAATHGRAEIPLPDQLLPTVPAATSPPAYRQPGVNLAGFLTAELGVGEVARRLAAACDAASLPLATVGHTRTTSRTDHTFAVGGEPRFDTNIVCINPDSLNDFWQSVGPEFFAGAYTIGVWFWETDLLPAMFLPAFDDVDEIWAASDFIADAIRAAAPRPMPILRFPLPITAPVVAAADRSAFDLPADRPIFLASFDYLSDVDRKNPLGTIGAFRSTFPDGSGPLLVVKSINGDRRPDATELVRQAAGDRTDIRLLDGYLSSEENAALLACCDAYVSLHRSEGFGLNIADAIALGTPVITTGYSGSMAFTASDDCWLVPHRLVEVGPGHFPYPPESRWADPDLAVAADAMRAIVTDPASAAERAARARARVERDFGVAATGAFIRNRLAAVRGERPAPPVTRASGWLRRRGS